MDKDTETIDAVFYTIFIGNDNIHALTSQKKYKLRIDLEDFKGNKRYAEYSYFRVADAKNKYKLEIGTYSGNAGNYKVQLLGW